MSLARHDPRHRLPVLPYRLTELEPHIDARTLVDLPEAARASVRTNAGGHVNHSLFWRAMTPQGGGEPSGQLGKAITRDFGSFETMTRGWWAVVDWSEGYLLLAPEMSKAATIPS